jgi:hypothetical protein
MPGGNVTVTAEFESSDETVYEVEIDPGIENGTVIAAPKFAGMGETVTLLVSTGADYRLKGMRVSTDSTGIETSSVREGKDYTFTMPAGDVTVTAEFESALPDVYAIDIESLANGTITSVPPTGSEAGKEVTLLVVPAEGYRLPSTPAVTPVEDGIPPITPTGGAGVYQFTMPASAVTVSAVFEELPTFTVTIDNEIPEGFITATPSGAVAAGKTVVLSVAGNIAYKLTGDGISVKKADDNDVEIETINSLTYTFTMPASNVTVYAECEEEPDPGEISVEISGPADEDIIFYDALGETSLPDPLELSVTDEPVKVRVSGGYQSVAWFVDGNPTDSPDENDAENVFTINPADYTLKVHSLTVRVYTEKAPYTRTFSFKVR